MKKSKYDDLSWKKAMEWYTHSMEKNFQQAKECRFPELEELQQHLKIILKTLEDKKFEEIDRDYLNKVGYDSEEGINYFFEYIWEHPIDSTINFIKCSSVISIMSLCEKLLTEIYTFLQKEFPRPKKLTDLHGGRSILYSFRIYLKQFGPLSSKLVSQWDILNGLYKIRNLITHGGILKLNDEKMPVTDKNTFRILKKTPGVFWEKSGQITIQDNFYTHAFNEVNKYFILLGDELNRLLEGRVNEFKNS